MSIRMSCLPEDLLSRVGEHMLRAWDHKNGNADMIEMETIVSYSLTV